MSLQGRRRTTTPLRPVHVWPLGFTDATPADRRQLAGLLGALALAALALARSFHALETAPLAPEVAGGNGMVLAWWVSRLLAVVAGGATAVLALAVAARYRSADRPFYPGPAGELIEIWPIVPGERIGPLGLGPLGAETIQLLRARAGFLYLGWDRVLCVLPHWEGATVVTATTDEMPPDDRRPDPARFREIIEVSTTSPIHLGPGGLRVGTPMPEAAALLGMPDSLTPPAEVVALERSLEYHRGLGLCVRSNQVRGVTISPAGEGDAS